MHVVYKAGECLYKITSCKRTNYNLQNLAVLNYFSRVSRTRRPSACRIQIYLIVAMNTSKKQDFCRNQCFKVTLVFKV